MREFLSAVDMLTETIESSPEPTPSDGIVVFRARNWLDLKRLCEQSVVGQIRGIFDFDTNEAVIGDATVCTHQDLKRLTGVSGPTFYIQNRFGTSEKIEIKDGLAMSTDCTPDDVTPAFARLLDMSWDDYERRWNDYVDRL